MPCAPYPSDLADAEWAILKPLIPTSKPGGRPPCHDRREIVDAIRYVLRGAPILPRCWVVEQTFAWLGRWRRLSKDHEQLPSNEVAWIQVEMIQLMTRRLAK